QSIYNEPLLTSPDLILSQNYNLVGGVPRTFQNLGKIQTLNVNNCPKLGGDLYFLDNLTTVVQFQGGFSNFTGQIPASVGQMSHLSIFNAMGNQLTGSIPDFHPLANISTIGLFENNLTGLIPANFGVDLRNLDLTGSIPDFHPLANISTIGLFENNLTGLIPANFGVDLRNLDVSSNQLGGYLRREWTRYKNLTVLKLNDNNIGSAGPNYYDNNLAILQSLQKLKMFDVSNNPLGGELLIDAFDYLDNIEVLRLSGCNLSGIVEVSSSTLAMPYLQTIDLSNNNFIRQLPFWMGYCPNVINVNMSNNHFTELAISWAIMSKLEVLDLSHNEIAGEITNAVAIWPYMQVLLLDDNQLSGPIPTEMGNLTRLTRLGLSRNNLYAENLNFLSSMRQLEKLDLSHNQIMSELPDSMSDSLTYVDLSHNVLWGHVNTSIFNLRHLDTMDLSNNRLSGAVETFRGDPKYIDLSNNTFMGDVNFVGNLLSIVYLNISGNQFTGPMPSLANRQKLETVDISSNQLSGQLPDFTGISDLRYLNASNNMFSGAVPSFSQSQSLSQFDVSYNNITLAREASFNKSASCSTSHNPLRCPVDWAYIQRCSTTCQAIGNETVRSVVYHLDLVYETFDATDFLSKLSAATNVTQSRLSINNTRPGSVIATVDVHPPSSGGSNEGSVEDTVQVMESIEIQEYESAGLPLLAPAGQTAEKAAPNVSQSIPTGAIAGGVIAGFICLVVITVIIFVLYRNHLRRESYKKQFAMVDITQLNTATVKKSMIDYEDLKSLEPIGSGAFGIVYKGKWRETQVAVKQMRAEHVTQKQLEDFLHEVSVTERRRESDREQVSILQGLKAHPNIVTFIGLTLPPQPVSLVTEYCSGGSLYSHLRRVNCSIEEKYKFLNEISLGMLHLHKEKIIHRDLAVRNILLTRHLEAKVADFGLSREQEDTEEASQTQSKVGPLKWMAPEAITSREYSIKSDVFSFGVVMWEVLEVREPWDDQAAVEVAFGVVHRHQRLPISDDTPPVLMDLMERCWRADRTLRPDFGDITEALSQQREKDADTANATDHCIAQLKQEGYDHDLGPGTKTVESGTSHEYIDVFKVKRYEGGEELAMNGAAYAHCSEFNVTPEPSVEEKDIYPDLGKCVMTEDEDIPRRN
ncbi:CLL6 clavata1-like receptor S/T protein kinase protein, partial [Planoprotostelium fungivorum]